MANFNRVILAGNLTADPELKFTQGGIPVCNFSLAYNNPRNKGKDSERTEYFDFTAWRELGELIANYKKKGEGLLVEGRLQYRTWEAQDGSKRSKVDIVADNVQFLGSKNGGSGQSSGRRDRVREDINESDFEDIPF